MLRPDLRQIGQDGELDLVVELVSRGLTTREVIPELFAVRSDSRVNELRELAADSTAGLLKDDGRKTEQIALARASNRKCC